MGQGGPFSFEGENDDCNDRGSEPSVGDSGDAAIAAEPVESVSETAASAAESIREIATDTLDDVIGGLGGRNPSAACCGHQCRCGSGVSARKTKALNSYEPSLQGTSHQRRSRAISANERILSVLPLELLEARKDELLATA